MGQIAAEAGVALDELVTVRESLEDVFLTLTGGSDHHVDDDGQDRHEDEVTS